MTLDDAIRRTEDIARVLHEAEKSFIEAAAVVDLEDAAQFRRLARALLEARAEIASALLNGARESASD